MSLPVLSLTESQTFAALRSFLLAIFPTGTDVIKAEVNRVPEPQAADFVVMTATLRQRLETNRNAYVDSSFTGSLAGTVLTVTAVALGKVNVQDVSGVNVAAGTKVTGQLTGPAGGPGTYSVSPAQTLSSRKLSTGYETLLQATEVTMQLDIHGPASANNAQIFSTLFRDDFAYQQFLTSGVDVSPLYTGEPHQAPFLNGEQQIEYRWSVDAVLQCNPVVTVPQQFLDQAEVTPIHNVLAEFPS